MTTRTNTDRASRILGEEASHDELTAVAQAIGLVLLDIHHALEQIGALIEPLSTLLQPTTTTRHIPIDFPEFDEDGLDGHCSIVGAPEGER